jgi:predicted  nucleic acid-binding Zn-ribbon protein
MFDFIKKFFAVETEKRPITADMSKLDEILSKQKEREFSAVFSKAEEAKHRIAHIFEEVKRRAEEMEHIKLNEEVDPRIAVRLESAKQNVVNQSMFICDKFSKENIGKLDSHEKLISFRDLVNDCVINANKTGARYGEIVSIRYGTQFKNLCDKFKRLGESFREFEEILAENREKFESYEEISKKITELSEKQQQTEKIGERIKQLDSEIEDSGKWHSDLEKKYNEFKASKEYTELSMAIEAKKGFEEKRETLKVEFRNKFSTFDKAVQKYLHSFGGSLQKEEINLVKTYLEEPMFGLENDYEFMMKKFLEEIRSHCQKESFGFEEKMNTKIADLATEFIDKRVLETYFEKYHSLERLWEEQRQVAEGPIYSKLVKLEEGIKQTESEIRGKNSEISRLNEKEEHTKKEIIHLEAKISKIALEKFNISLSNASQT